MFGYTRAEKELDTSGFYTEVQCQLREDFYKREKKRHPKAFTQTVANLPSRIAAGGPPTIKLKGCRWRLPEYTGFSESRRRIERAALG